MKFENWVVEILPGGSGVSDGALTHDQSFSIPPPMSAKSSTNSFAQGREPASLESTVGRTLPPLKILRQKVKSNPNEPPISFLC